MTQRILVTGGTSGFGKALAQVYAARGDKVLVTDLAADVGAAALPLASGGGEVAYLQLDVRETEAWLQALAWVEGRWGGLDLLLNNAGVGAGGRIDVVPLADWDWIIAINLLGVVKGCRVFTPLFKRQGSGRIVNVASMAGLVHPLAMGSYSSVKAAVVALSETLLHELAPFGVEVSVVCPSFFRTNLDRSILRGSDPTMEQSGARLVSDARTGAETTAARTVEALDKGRYLVLPHPQGALAYRAKRFAPALYHRAMKRAGRRVAVKAAERDAAAGRG